jgi:hypothetical protein
MVDVSGPSRWQSFKFIFFLVGTLFAFVLFCCSLYIAFAWPRSWGLTIIALGILGFFLNGTLYNAHPNSARHPKLARFARIRRSQKKAAQRTLWNDGISRTAFYAGFAVILLPMVIALIPTVVFPKDYFRSYSEVDAFFSALDKIEWFALAIGLAISILVPMARQLYLAGREHGSK